MHKTNNLVYLIIALIIGYISCYYFLIIPHYRGYVEIYNLISWFLIFIISLITLKSDKNTRKIKKDTNQVVFIAVILYFIILFLLGIFIGFSRNPLSLKIIDILKNISLYGFVILFEEYVRLNIISNSKKGYLLTVILFTIIDVLYLSVLADFTTNVGIFKFLSMVLLPTISKNILLSYMTIKVGFGPSVIYRLLMELYLYILPIFPATGEYVDAIVLFIFPLLLFFYLYNLYQKDDTRIRKEKKTRSSKTFLILVTILLVGIICLISGLFKYQIIAIVSNSMIPDFSRGDAVIFRKVDKDIDSVKVDDVLVYKKDNIYVVHRIVEKGKDYVITKGDNNESNDYSPIKTSEFIGIKKVDIPIIGYPSVWLQEILAS